MRAPSAEDGRERSGRDPIAVGAAATAANKQLSCSSGAGCSFSLRPPKELLAEPSSENAGG
jgi:hypothetical protein